MSRTHGHGQRRSRRRTESTQKVLGVAWHLHDNERKGERKSKRHAKRNQARRERLAAQNAIQQMLAE